MKWMQMVVLLGLLVAGSLNATEARTVPRAEVEDPARLLPQQPLAARALEVQLAALAQSGGTPFVMRFHEMSPTAEEDRQPGAYMRGLAERVGTARRGVLAVYFADEDDWRLWIGDDSVAAFVGRSELVPAGAENGKIHEQKEILFAAMRAEADAVVSAWRQTAAADEAAVAAQRRWREAEAIVAGLTARFGKERLLVWSDEFDQPEGMAPDPARWVCEEGHGQWGNNELETYTDARENAHIAGDAAATDGKALVIRALKTADGYTSGRFKTLGKFGVTFGRIEARLKSTNGQGLWPAFWMLGETIETVDWPACGEIDVMEIAGAAPTKAFGTLHGPGYSGAKGIGRTHTLPAGGRFDETYHVFAVEWLPDLIVWSIDGTVYHTATPESLPAGTRWVFNAGRFFLLLNLAVGGDFSGYPDETTVFPATYRIDYVRVYAPLATASGKAAETETSAKDANRRE